MSKAKPTLLPALPYFQDDFHVKSPQNLTNSSTLNPHLPYFRYTLLSICSVFTLNILLGCGIKRIYIASVPAIWEKSFSRAPDSLTHAAAVSAAQLCDHSQDEHCAAPPDQPGRRHYPRTRTLVADNAISGYKDNSATFKVACFTLWSLGGFVRIGCKNLRLRGGKHERFPIRRAPVHDLNTGLLLQQVIYRHSPLGCGIL